ncbi:hypothetical protein SAMN06264364_1551, partial [Quadrisphaera granulorum]
GYLLPTEWTSTAKPPPPRSPRREVTTRWIEAELRKRFGLDAPGAQLELTEREDGVLEMRPMIAVPVRQAGFWTPEWQAGEAEFEEHVQRGAVISFASMADFMADLDAPEGSEQSSQDAGHAE